MMYPGCRRILVYAQHLSGVGHYVRSFEIARELATRHQVYWIEGGRPVPHRVCPGLHIVELPRIRRGADGRLQALDNEAEHSKSITEVMRKRAAQLLAAVERIRPEVFLVEYFPFSKWELADELLPAITAVRANGGRVLCSLRDVVAKTRHEAVSDQVWQARVTDLVNSHFDALLVHAAPALTRLDQHFAGVAKLHPPIHYTGLVSERLLPSSASDADIKRVTGDRPFVLVSAGGGGGGRKLIEQVCMAWQDPDLAAGRPLVICAGLGWPDTELRQLTRPVGNRRIIVLPFREDFLHWLARADLSISQCGYNTATNLLQTRTPAIVCPNPAMSDQAFRARRLSELGLVELFDSTRQAHHPRDPLAKVIDRVLDQPRTACPVDLEGAQCTRRLIETNATSY